MSDCMIVFIISNLKNGSENYFLVLANLVQDENEESHGEYLGLSPSLIKDATHCWNFLHQVKGN